MGFEPVRKTGGAPRMTANQVSVRFVKQQGRLGQVHIGPALREALYEAGWSDDTRVATLIDRDKKLLAFEPVDSGGWALAMAGDFTMWQISALTALKDLGATATKTARVPARIDGTRLIVDCASLCNGEA